MRNSRRHPFHRLQISISLWHMLVTWCFRVFNFMWTAPLYGLFSLVRQSPRKAPHQQANYNKQHQNNAGQSDDSDKVDIGKIWKTFKKKQRKRHKEYCKEFRRKKKNWGSLRSFLNKKENMLSLNDGFRGRLEDVTSSDILYHVLHPPYTNSQWSRLHRYLCDDIKVKKNELIIRQIIKQNALTVISLCSCFSRWLVAFY